MKILFLGDLVGRPAREAVKVFLAKESKKIGVDIVVINADNLAHGKGVTRRTLEEMLSSGVDFITCGDHAWDNTQVFDILKKNDLNFISPANCPKFESGIGYKIFTFKKQKILFINLLGNVFVTRESESPFVAVDKILEENKIKNIIVDFHAEATSEKLAMLEHLDGRVSAVLGSHTHVQTADDIVTEKGTVYISDMGMVGIEDSILGSSKKSVLGYFLGSDKFKYELAEGGEVMLCGVVFDIDNKTGKGVKIERVRRKIFLDEK